MSELSSLASLDVGQWGEIHSIMSTKMMNTRLRDLGMIEGTRVQCLLKSPFGDPAAYLIRGSAIALRRADAENIQVERVEP